jgi:hypothetical protein
MEETEIANILEVSLARNAEVGITGGLINTTYAFAQLLEGPGQAIDDLMQRIEEDWRHANVQILRYDAIMRRRLPDWSMAYSGPSTYVANQIEQLLGKDIEPESRKIDRLINMLVQLAEAQADPVG